MGLTEAWAINNAGQIVGFSPEPMYQGGAFLYENGIIQDLNDLIPANSGWTLTFAQDINNAGQIVGHGGYNGQGLVFLLTPSPTADLSLTLTDTPDPVRVGDNLTYQLIVSNNGPDTATDITLTDTLPSGVTSLSLPSECTDTGAGTITCDLGSLPTGTDKSVEMVVTATASGPLTNTVSVTANESDTNQANNKDTEVTTVTNPSLNLNIDRPPLKNKQDFGIYRAQLEYELLEVTASERNNYNQDDQCYHGTVDAIAALQAKRIIDIALRQLSGQILKASITPISTGSLLGDYLLKFSAEVINATVAGIPLDEAILKFVAEDTIGYIAGKVTADYIAGKTVEILNRKVVERLLKRDDSIAWELTGDNSKSRLFIQGLVPLTSINSQLFYNPYTHYTSALVNSTCVKDGQTQIKLYGILYEVIKTAFNTAKKVGPLKLVVRNLSQ